MLTSGPRRPSTGWKLALVIVKRYDFMVQLHTMLVHGDRGYFAAVFRTSADGIVRSFPALYTNQFTTGGGRFSMS